MRGIGNNASRRKSGREGGIRELAVLGKRRKHTRKSAFVDKTSSSRGRQATKPPADIQVKKRGKRKLKYFNQTHRNQTGSVSSRGKVGRSTPAP